MPKKKKMKTGTKEWSSSSLNIATGCTNCCRYCFARHNALRFKRIPDAKAWGEMDLNPEKAWKKYGKRKGTIMFPTSHDIVPGILASCIRVLRQVLSVGNEVLIVTKPRFYCVAELCAALKDYIKQVEFRFTIGSNNDEVLWFWEPGAPDFKERLDSLDLAYLEGFETSVSIEPMLDPANVGELVDELDDFVTNTIWIGKMNKPGSRCVGVSKDDLEEIKAGQTDAAIMDIVEQLSDNPKIRWKDSIKKVIAKHENGMEDEDEDTADKPDESSSKHKLKYFKKLGATGVRTFGKKKG